MRLNAFELQRYLSACAGKADCRVVYEDKVQPRTDGKTVYLPYVNMFTSDERANHLIHFVNHETSHIRFTAFSDVPEYHWMSPMYSILGMIWGLFEDNRVDYLNDSVYLGDKHTNMEVMKAYAPQFRAGIQTWEQEDQDRMMSCLLMFEDVRSVFYHTAQEEFDEVKKIASPKAWAYYEKAKKLGIIQRMHAVKKQPDKIKGTRGTAEIAQDIWVRVFEDDLEKEKAKQEAIKAALKSGAKEGDTISVKYKPDESDPDQGPGKGDGVGPEGDQDGDEGERKTDEEFRIDIVDYSKGIPKLSHSLKPNGSVHNVGLKIELPKDQDDASQYKQPPVSDYPVLDFRHRERSTISIDDHWVSTGSPQQREYQKNIEGLYSGRQMEGFANRLRRLIQIKSVGRFEYGTDRGKLQRSLVHRVLLKDSSIQSKIFKRHVKSQVDDCAITILVDASGSMSGTKYLHASCAMMILSETIANVLHIPCELLAFTDGTGFKGGRGRNAQDMFIIRAFNENLLGVPELTARMATVSQFMGANGDGEAIVWALDRLLKQKQKRKLLIVLSDGQPVTDINGNIRAYTKEVVQKIQNTPNLTCVGIGIMSDAVKDYYKHHRVIQDAKDIEHTLLEVLREAILENSFN